MEFLCGSFPLLKPSAGINFTNHTITTSADSARSTFTIDMDVDGDMDVLSASQHDDKIAWYGNDGSQSFTAHTISTSANDAFSVFAIDLDGDGDIDVCVVCMIRE